MTPLLGQGQLQWGTQGDRDTQGMGQASGTPWGVIRGLWGAWSKGCARQGAGGLDGGAPSAVPCALAWPPVPGTPEAPRSPRAHRRALLRCRQRGS